ncbi:restriction endonuclease subunit S [Pantoea dispersa]|uniref:restriction endonuclease subunit S n=1 Tax=Enterobacterales TaxID=91347 RepID=UPI000D772369|nr:MULTISPECIES: restriction endonuclease subunit S [Pantoea]MEB5973252.1 restriction endonuclease subunit S [Pantoea dispersa]PXV70831.1 type I restriction enzyme S subunit [Pantoea sp. PNA 03-3]
MNPISIATSLPSHWREVRFRYIAATSKGRLPAKEEEDVTVDVLPYLSMEYLRGDTEASQYVPAQGMLTAEDNDVLLLWDGSNAGEFLKAKHGAVSSTTSLVTPLQFDRQFLFWICKAVEPVLKTFTNGMGIPHVDGEFLKNLKLPCPTNPDEQSRIAIYLDREIVRIDGLIAEKERMLALLEEKRAALISRVVTRGLEPNVPLNPSGQEWLGEIPAHWGLQRIKYVIISIDQGSSPIAANTPAGPDELGVLKLSAVSKGRFKREENKALRGTDEEEQLLSLRKGDVLITRGNTPELVADVACVPYAEPNLLLPDLIYRLRVHEKKILPEYLTSFLTTAAARVQIRRDARGSSGTMVKVSQGHVLDWLTPLPPLNEQVEIVECLERAEERFQSITREVSSSLSLLLERRTALITAAVTGQIPPEEITS